MVELEGDQGRFGKVRVILFHIVSLAKHEVVGGNRLRRAGCGLRVIVTQLLQEHRYVTRSYFGCILELEGDQGRFGNVRVMFFDAVSSAIHEDVGLRCLVQPLVRKQAKIP